MKRWLVWSLLIVLFIAGCSDPAQTPVDTTLATQTQNTDPVRSLYWSGSALEQSADSAVKVFCAEDMTIDGIDFLDGNPVLMTNRDDGIFAVSMDPETGAVKAEKLLNGNAVAETMQGAPNVVMAGNRLAYYDEYENAIRILDGSFMEFSKIKLHQSPESAPLISKELSEAYYCEGSTVFALDLQTGIARMVCQRGNESIQMVDLLLNDSVLCCIITDEDGKSCVEFLDANNGISLAVDRNMLTIESQGIFWLATRLDGITKEVLLGFHEEVFGFTPDNPAGSELQLLSAGILEREVSGTTALISLYDVKTGNRSSQLTLDGVECIYTAVADPTGSYIWLVCRESLTQQDVLLRWNPSVSGGTDTKLRVASRHTAENPDTEGLTSLKRRADEIGEKYGVQIHIGGDIPAAEGFTIAYEYQVDAFAQALETLDRALNRLPDGFLKTAATVTNDERFHIGLIRSVQANEIGGNPQADGLQYWVNGCAWITLCVGDSLELSFYHNLCHALDTYVYSNSIHYDFWSNCNPTDFQYDETYLYVDAHAGNSYLTGRERAFIDAFSMTFPHEDRATIFAYAVMEGAEDYFDSYYMQLKLKQLSMGIREAFGWEDENIVFLWEQYLKEK